MNEKAKKIEKVMKRRLFWRVLLLALLSTPDSLSALECTPLVLAKATHSSLPYGKGLLWKVSRGGGKPSYLFGTMHVGDAEVVELPREVSTVFQASSRLILEAELNPRDAMEFSKLMTYADGGRLNDALGEELFERTVDLLWRYGITRGSATTIKPWAAYLTLSMPPANGIALDMVLAQRAAEQGTPVYGLESLKEQGAVLSTLPLSDQIGLLKDTVCHYQAMQQDVATMKKLYLQRDLAGLMAMADKYEIAESARYRRLLETLLWSRNKRMAERMQPYLDEGDSFIAIGALHLPDTKGVLAILAAKGYRVVAVY
ncbi:MAG: TraB/GumN family protein [Gammaproteobacteria bacterium]